MPAVVLALAAVVLALVFVAGCSRLFVVVAVVFCCCVLRVACVLFVVL